MPDFEIKEVESMKIAAHKMHCQYGDVGPGFGLLCKKVAWRANGKPFCLYHEHKEPPEPVNLEVCIPVKPSATSSDQVEVREIPGCRMLSCIHYGPYEKLKDAYYAIEKYIQENSLNVTGPVREIYIKGPGMILKGNPEKYVTEIQFPLEES